MYIKQNYSGSVNDVLQLLIKKQNVLDAKQCITLSEYFDGKVTVHVFRVDDVSSYKLLNYYHYEKTLKSMR